MKNFEFEKKQAAESQLPIPPYTLDEIIKNENFDHTGNSGRGEEYYLELNTNQDSMKIQIIDQEYQKDSGIDLGHNEYRIQIELDRDSKGRGQTGKNLYTWNEIQAVRFILEIFDKHGQCGNQYEEYYI